MLMTKAEALKDTKKVAADLGLTFKVDNSVKIAGKTAYKLTDRKTGDTVASYFTANSGYADSQSGRFAELAAEYRENNK